MGIHDIGEFGFIDRIREGCLIRPERVVKAIGDDAAAFETSSGQLGLITTDMLVDRIHFLREAIAGDDLGYKSLAVNLSDIAAMGGIAREAFVSIAIPENCDLDYLDQLYRGMKRLAEKYGVNILGGDTTASKTDLIINVAVFGAAPPDQILYRSGALPGDTVFCTGCLGDSRAGLEMILNSVPAENRWQERLREAHLRPEPHLREGRFLASSPGVHSAIDVSDGLSSDIGHLLEESGVGARLSAADIPLSVELKKYCAASGSDPVTTALSGGEDYVLLGTCAADQAAGLQARFEKEFDRPLFYIGEITAGRDPLLTLPDGRVMPIAKKGWDHFKENSNERI
jgi:thiamine-monophosphate kinase